MGEDGPAAACGEAQDGKLSHSWPRGSWTRLLSTLREVRRQPTKNEWTAVSGVDPLNLAGILTPGPRLAALAGNRLLYCDGVPAATLSDGEIRFVDPLDPTTEWFARNALMRGTRRAPFIGAEGYNPPHAKKTWNPQAHNSTTSLKVPVRVNIPKPWNGASEPR
jgi:hypothetical protein